MIVCAAGDPGGSRAILQVIRQMEQDGIEYTVIDHGYLAKELPIDLKSRLRSLNSATGLISVVDAYLFGSSVSDLVPLHLARQARDNGVPVVHILDAWSSYLKRLQTDGLSPLIPDVYAVPDAIARDMAIAEGVPTNCIEITGHPCMGSSVARSERCRDGNKIHVAFISEPFSMALGRDTNLPGHPGFTEDKVLQSFCATMAQYAETSVIHILPHPKQDIAAMEESWDACSARVGGGTMKALIHLPGQGSAALAWMDGIAGMASSLLYEAWLSGVPCLCMQPDCRAPDMRRFSLLDGIFYADTWQDIRTQTARWFERCAKRESIIPPRPERELHKQASQRITDVLKKLTRRSNQVCAR